MIRLILALMLATGCVWVLFYGVPDEWRGAVWLEVRKWLQVATAVSVVICLIGLFSLASS